MLAKMMDGLTVFKESYPSPNLSSFPGIKFSTLSRIHFVSKSHLGRPSFVFSQAVIRTHTTSALRARPRIISFPFSLFKLTVIERLFRLTALKNMDVLVDSDFQIRFSSVSRQSRVSSYTSRKRFSRDSIWNEDCKRTPPCGCSTLTTSAP